jgi:signal peptidase I
MKRFIILFSMLFILMGCSNNPTIETITDPDTKLELEVVEQEENMIVLEYHSDNMERGAVPYNYLGRFLVIDPEYYLTQDVQRGEVVLYEQPEAYYVYLEEWTRNRKEQDENFETQPDHESIARIIALSGETIKIKNGQIYIDDKKLDTFYGDGTQNVRSIDSDKAYSMEPLLVPEGNVFVSGDLWWRGSDSKQYGAIPIENIIGKVKGYKK